MEDNTINYANSVTAGSGLTLSSSTHTIAGATTTGYCSNGNCYGGYTTCYTTPPSKVSIDLTLDSADQTRVMKELNKLVQFILNETDFRLKLVETEF